MRTRLLLETTAVSAFIIGTGVGSGALAQASGASDEIVVTALKREQSVQDVPATIGVTPGQQIQDFVITDAIDLAAFSPGLTIKAIGHGPATASIRGLGTQPGSSVFDQSVSMFVDGIYMSRSTGFVAGLFDIERVEVIKGPQSTLLGKNSSLGAISVVTREPTNEFEGFATGGYEIEREGYLAEGAVSGPLSQDVSMRLAGRLVRNGGWVLNTATGEETPIVDQVNIRAKINAQVSDGVGLKLSYQYDNRDREGDAAQYLTNNSGNASEDGGVPDNIKNNSTIAPGVDTFNDFEQHRASFTANVDVGRHLLTAQSTYTNHDNVFDIDMDGLPYLPGRTDVVLVEENYEQFSQELRFTSSEEIAVPFIVGAYYLKGDYRQIFSDFDGGNIAGPPIPSAFPNVPTDFDQDAWSVAGFASAEIALTDRLLMRGGGRLTHEQKDVDNIFAGRAPIAQSFKSTSFDANASLTYDFADNASLYFAYGRGSKSGGFSEAADPLLGNEVRDEKTNSYEFGLRSRVIDNRLVFNATAFNTNVKDFQFTQFTGTAFVTNNLPVRSRGFEVDTRFLASDFLTFYGGFVYADAIDKTTNQQLERAPKWDATFGGNLTYTANFGVINLDVNGNYVSTLPNDPPPSAGGNPVVFGTPGEPMAKINARLSYVLPNDALEFAVLARNLFDEQAVDFASPLTCTLTCLPPESFGVYTERRTVMLQATARF